MQQGRSAGHFAEPAAYLSGSGTRSDGATWGAWLLGLGAGMVRSLGSAVLGPTQSPTAEFVVTSQVEKVRSINRQFIDVYYGSFVKILTLIICVVDPYSHSFGFPESGSVLGMRIRIKEHGNLSKLTN